MTKDSEINIIECPRDAMQGIQKFIPTEVKIKYLNLLLKAGFHTLDFGSFVSPKAVPQMADTEEVLHGLELTATHLLAIIANLRGAEKAVQYEQIKYLGYPLSVSETFQQRNTNKSISESLVELEAIQALCLANGKELVVYLSMAFGNPYEEMYSSELVLTQAGKLVEMGVNVISLADTIGSSTPQQIGDLYAVCSQTFDKVEWGLHLHTTPQEARKKLEAVKAIGCKRIDGALGGYGGCPFAQNELVGNMPTEVILEFFQDRYTPNSHLQAAMEYSKRVFSSYP